MSVIVTGVIPCFSRAVMIQRLVRRMHMEPCVGGQKSNAPQRKDTIAFFCRSSRNSVSQEAFLSTVPK